MGIFIGIPRVTSLPVQSSALLRSSVASRRFRLCSSLPSQLPRIYRFTAALIVADLISQLRLGLEGVVAVVIARRRRRSNGRFKINISSRRLHQIVWQTSDLGTFRVNSSLAK